MDNLRKGKINMWAIIGGSGFEKFDDVELVEEYKGETPFGQTSSGLKKIKVSGQECLFLSRHGQHHEKLPSEVNYRANIFALKQLGATQILSVSAVGSLVKECAPGEMVVPTQYIDRTKSVRAHTFCGDGVVGHTSLAHPVCSYWAEQIEKFSQDLDFKIHFKKTYVCIEGPYFSTQAESKSYRTMGADIIGMTNFPEFALAREAGMGYVPCSFVTDYDCWDDSIEHVTLQEVIKVMKNNNQKAFALIGKILNHQVAVEDKDRLNYSSQGLQTSLMTPLDSVSEAKKEWLQVLMR